MSRKDLTEHLLRCVAREERALADFKEAIEKHHFQIFERDVNGERDTTDRHLKEHEAACEEYRRLMRMWSAE